MMFLTREVRFSLLAEGLDQPANNSWSGWPSPSSIAPYLILRCTLQGELEAESSYICNIKLIDEAVRQRVIVPACQNVETSSHESLVQFAWRQLKDSFPKNCQLHRLELIASPYLSYSVFQENPAMVQVTQQFEFSAAHRLHNPDLSDEKNKQLFGKCNNPHGHGHNYVVMVTVEGEPKNGSPFVSMWDFESLVKQHVIDRLDHRHLNVEIAEFQDLNPSVENIAKVVWQYLQPHIGKLASGAVSLTNIRVHETPKTWADYCGN